MGYNFDLSDFVRSVPKELMVILMARRSASNSRISFMTESVGEGSDKQKERKSSKYALYSVLRMISMLSSSSSAAERHSLK